MRFQVPQFIDVEDKIFGPLTIKQFVYLAGGGGLSFIIFRFTPLIISIVLITAVVVFSLIMAFYQVNNRPFIFLAQNAFNYFISNKLYLWKKGDNKIQNITKQKTESTQTPLYVPKLSGNKLHDLTWSLDIKEALNPITRGDDISK